MQSLAIATTIKSWLDRMRSIFGSSIVAYWPCDETSGINTNDISGHGYNGVLNGTYTLANIVGPAGKLYPNWLSTGGINAYSALLATNFPYAAGSLIGFAKCASWTDGVARQLAIFRVDANNQIYIQRQTTSNTLNMIYQAGGVAKGVGLTGISMTGVFMFALTWSKAGDTVDLYINGAKMWPTSTGIGTWAGTIISTQACLAKASGGNFWNSMAGEFLLLNRVATAAELFNISKIANIGLKRVSILGDSISDGYDEWFYTWLRTWNGGNNTPINHATVGSTIVANLATQAAACVNDDADMIIIHMGTNDNNAGDMSALQATMEAAIDTLRVSNPRATINIMNVLPKWTDAGGGTPVDKSNIRAAEAAAGASRSVTVWDTFTSPVITAADTIDGTHLITSGTTKLVSFVSART